MKFTEKASELTGVPFDTPLVPTQLIEAIANLLLFAGLLWLWKRRKFDGQIIFAYFIAYSVIRFTIEFWRDDPRGAFLGLSTSQLISVVMLPLGIALMIYYGRRSPDKKITPQKKVAAQAS
jgi:phosphatidylglycerol---prolipoprotein diacylglyceryl transferase